MSDGCVDNSTYMRVYMPKLSSGKDESDRVNAEKWVRFNIIVFNMYFNRLVPTKLLKYMLAFLIEMAFSS